MTLKPSQHRWTLAALLVAVCAVTFAPMALADHGSRRWKHTNRGPAHYASGHRSHYGAWRGPGARVVIRDRHYYGPGPVLAGLVGGFILGSVLNPRPVVVRERYSAPPVVVHEHYYNDNDREEPRAIERERYEEPQAAPAPVYRYEDGNGERWWDTLDECTDAARDRDGPRVIKVVEDGTNQLVKTLYWNKDRWIEDDQGR